MTAPEQAWVALGSNLGEREAHLLAALAALRVLARDGRAVPSRVYETDAVGPGAQGPYLNAVVRIAPRLEPEPLLAALLAVEAARGRTRGAERNTARTLDLDLLVYGERRLAVPGLTLPHPRLAERGFVLAPFADLDPERVVPGQARAIAALAADRHEPGAVRVHAFTEDPQWPSPPSASRR